MTNTTFKVMDSFQLTLRYVYCLQQRAGRGPENEATPQVATLFYLLYLLVQNNLFVQLCIRGLVRVCFLWSDEGINPSLVPLQSNSFPSLLVLWSYSATWWELECLRIHPL